MLPHGPPRSLYQQLVLRPAGIGWVEAQSIRSILGQCNGEIQIEICHVLSASRPIFLQIIKAYLHSVDCNGLTHTRRWKSAILVSLLFPIFPNPIAIFFQINDSVLNYISFLMYIFFFLYSSLPSWLPPAMLEIRILALYLGNHELCSKYFAKVNSVV